MNHAKIAFLLPDLAGGGAERVAVTLANAFARRGHAVELVLMRADGALLPAIEAAFPGSTGREGVDRDRLGQQVFADKQALARLEAIVHPAVATSRAAFLRVHHGKRAVVFDIPLLFERAGHETVDTIVVVSAPEDVQRARVLARPGMTTQKFAHILSLQLGDTEKRERADHVIDTGTSLEETRAQVAAFIASI